MLIFLAAIASQTSTQVAPAKPSDPITVIGKAKRVCVQSIVTGSRARGGRVCRNKDDAAAEQVAGREAAREAMEIGRIREALLCDALNSNGCN